MIQSFLSYIKENKETEFINIEKYDFKSLFNFLNEKAFYNKLEWIPIEFKKLKNESAYYKFSRYNKSKKILKDSQKFVFNILFEWTEKDIKNTFAHEMLHYYIAYVLGDTYEVHGKLFKNELNRINLELKEYEYNISIKHEIKDNTIKDEKINKVYYLCYSIIDDNKIIYSFLNENTFKHIKYVIDSIKKVNNNENIELYKIESAKINYFNISKNINIFANTDKNFIKNIKSLLLSNYVSKIK